MATPKRRPAKKAKKKAGKKAKKKATRRPAKKTAIAKPKQSPAPTTGKRIDSLDDLIEGDLTKPEESHPSQAAPPAPGDLRRSDRRPEADWPPPN